MDTRDSPKTIAPTLACLAEARQLSRQLDACRSCADDVEAARAGVMAAIYGSGICATYAQRRALAELVVAFGMASRAAGAADEDFHRLARDGAEAQRYQAMLAAMAQPMMETLPPRLPLLSLAA